MNMPGFTAEDSLYKTSGQYWMTATNTSTGQVLPQQDSFSECVQSSNSCTDVCASLNWPTGCGQACNDAFLDCTLSRSLGDGGGAGGGRLIERSGCFLDRTSSTGWRLRECYTIPGASGQATRCSWSDECPAPGCGPCRCTRAPDGTRTCTEQCFRYSQMTGHALTSARSCVPAPPPGSI